MNIFELSQLGERRVTEVLSGAVHVNGIKQKYLTYDVLWGDIKIDAKASTSIFVGEYCSRAIKSEDRHNGIVLVFVVFNDGDEYFWVDHHNSSTANHRRYIKDALKADQVADAVIKELTKMGVI